MECNRFKEMTFEDLFSRVRTCLENPWKPLNFESTFSRPWKSLKISALHSWSLKVLEFFLTCITSVKIISYSSHVIQMWQAVGSRMVTSAFALFSRIFVTENEQELYCQTISMGKIFDVDKKEVLEISKFGLESPWKVLVFLVWKSVRTLF